MLDPSATKITKEMDQWEIRVALFEFFFQICHIKECCLCGKEKLLRRENAEWNLQH